MANRHARRTRMPGEHRCRDPMRGRRGVCLCIFQYSRTPQGSICCQGEYVLRSVLLFPPNYISSFSEWHLCNKDALMISPQLVKKLGKSLKGTFIFWNETQLSKDLNQCAEKFQTSLISQSQLMKKIFCRSCESDWLLLVQSSLGEIKSSTKSEQRK